MKDGEVKLEAGKYYKTRSGQKAFVIARNPFSEGRADEFCGVIRGCNIGKMWAENGSWHSLGMEMGDDLVAEWVEPKRVKGWMNITKDNGALSRLLCS